MQRWTRVNFAQPDPTHQPDPPDAGPNTTKPTMYESYTKPLPTTVNINNGHMSQSDMTYGRVYYIVNVIIVFRHRSKTN